MCIFPTWFKIVSYSTDQWRKQPYKINKQKEKTHHVDKSIKTLEFK